MSFMIDYMVQPALVGLYVLAKDVLYDEYLPDNPHVLMDIASNVFAKLVSTIITVDVIVPYTTPMATWLEPAFHGAINGAIKHQMINTDNLNAISFIETGFESAATFTRPRGRARVVPPVHHYTYENGFIEGASYNLAAKITALPLDAMFGGDDEDDA